MVVFKQENSLSNLRDKSWQRWKRNNFFYWKSGKVTEKEKTQFWGREGRGKEQQIRRAKKLKNVESVWRVNQWAWPGRGSDGKAALKRGVQNQKIEGSIVKQELCQWMTKFLVRWSIQHGNQRMKVREVLQQNRWCWMKLKFPRLMLIAKEEKKPWTCRWEEKVKYCGEQILETTELLVWW